MKKVLTSTALVLSLTACGPKVYESVNVSWSGVSCSENIRITGSNSSSISKYSTSDSGSSRVNIDIGEFFPGEVVGPSNRCAHILANAEKAIEMEVQLLENELREDEVKSKLDIARNEEALHNLSLEDLERDY